MTSVGVPIAFGSTQYFTAIQNVGQVKSFVDDLVMKLGTVSMRVALVLRSAEVQPAFQDLSVRKRMAILPPLSPLPVVLLSLPKVERGMLLSCAFSPLRPKGLRGVYFTK